MNDIRFNEILKLLSEDIFTTAYILADKLEVSSRTIRNDIKELNKILAGNGAFIESIPNRGNRLNIIDKEIYQSFLLSLAQNNSKTPQTTKQRSYYLIEFLLTSLDWVKMDDLCETLFISKSSLSVNLKMVRQKLADYNIELISKPRYGIKAKGKEFDIRLCLADNKIEQAHERDGSIRPEEKEAIIESISEIVMSVFEEYHYHLSDLSRYNLLVHIYIAIFRAKDGKFAYLEDEQLQEIKSRNEFVIAARIMAAIEQSFQCDFPEAEIAYVAIHLAAKKISVLDHERLDNVVISDEINEVVSHMFQEIVNLFGIDFTEDLELRTMIALHLVPFSVRMAYDLVLHNPLLKEIKSTFPLAYNLAVAASDVLKTYYNKKIKEDEIGYFALHFNLALERMKSYYDKKNILIICSSEIGTLQLLVYRFQEKFDHLVNKIYTCEINSIKNMDFSCIDYIITTVPIHFSVPVPILEVRTFLEDSDIRNIELMLSGNERVLRSQYFSEDLFLVDLDFETKEEVLAYMVKIIKHIKNGIPDDFYKSILIREKLAVTEFSDLTAIPSPHKAISHGTFVCIALLRKPILWEKRKVQFVYLIAMEKNPGRDLINFYQLTSKFLMNKYYVNEILQKKDFKLFLEYFHRADSGF